MTSSLCGAWSLSGSPIGRDFRDADRDAMLRHCAARGELGQVALGPLWLNARSESLARDGSTVLGLEGSAVPASGHYVLAHADTKRKRLILSCDPGGGERLFYARAGNLLLFAASTRHLLETSLVPRKMNPATVTPFLMFGEAFLDPHTLFEGILEVPAGCKVIAENGEVRLERSANPLLWPLPNEGADFLSGARKLRDTLFRETALAIGRDKRVAISLSGGVDSAALAAAARELLGAANVRAFTYEFEDPAHPSEAAHAAELCRHLGIEHHTVKITFDEYFDALPAALWHLEEAGNRTGMINPAKLILARRVREAGFSKTLAGDGMEHLLNAKVAGQYLDAVERRIGGIASPEAALWHWRLRRFPPAAAAVLEPLAYLNERLTLDAPPADLYNLIVCALLHHGVVREAGGFYPPGLRELARAALEDPVMRTALARMDPSSLPAQLRHVSFWHYYKTRCLFRKSKMSRELGAPLLAPALFAGASALAGEFASGPREWRSGKRLLVEAFREDLPASIGARPKLPDQAVITRAWLSRILDSIEPLVDGSVESLRESVPGSWAGARKHCREPLLWLGLWRRMFVEAPLTAQPPRWEELRP